MDMEAPSDALLLQHIFSVTISRNEVALSETTKTLPSYILLHRTLQQIAQAKYSTQINLNLPPHLSSYVAI